MAKIVLEVAAGSRLRIKGEDRWETFTSPGEYTLDPQVTMSGVAGFTKSQLEEISDQQYGDANDIARRASREGRKRTQWEKWEQAAWDRHVEVGRAADRLLDIIEQAEKDA